MIDGLMVVWKEQDFTSHDAVAKLRGILRQKKIGHSGTLDPKAEGVLLVGLGLGTRACGILPQKDKIYHAGLKLGMATDTQDIWGTVLREETVHLDPERIEKAILSFEGDYMQVPPMYSAKKINGQKLYDLARKGQIIERKAVPVRINWIHILKISEDSAEFEVSCSEGTYIRTLCEDIGKELNVDACMSSLVRISACGFERNKALTLSEIEKARDEGTLGQYVIPLDQAFLSYPRLDVRPENEKLLLNGNPMPNSAWREVAKNPEGIFRVYLPNGLFAGLYEWSKEKQKFFAYKMLFRTGGSDDLHKTNN